MTLDTVQAEKQLVVFDLSTEAYGVDIGSVREIIRMQADHSDGAPDRPIGRKKLSASAR